jgi:hypothetical protein
MELRGFLRHYVGRDPGMEELQMVEKVVRLRKICDDKKSSGPGEEKGRYDHEALKNREDDRRGERGYVIQEAGSRKSWKDRDRDRNNDRMGPRSPIARNGSNGGSMSANMIPVNGTSRYPRQPLPTSQQESPPRVPSTSTEQDEHLQKSPLATASHPTVPAPQPAVIPSPSTTTPGKPGHNELYERLKCVGEGTYGKVYKAQNTENGAFVALKRIRMEGEKDGFPVTAMREIKLLQSLRHVNVVRLHEMMVSQGQLAYSVITLLR